MVQRLVKSKLGFFKNFTGRHGTLVPWLFPAIALLTFISSLAAVYPAHSVERWYGHAVFPAISSMAGRVADVVSFSWLDVAIPAALAFLVFAIRYRRFVMLLNVVAVLYLAFFWSWGLNYHRQPLSEKIQVDAAHATPEAIDQFARRAASNLNRLYVEKRNQPLNDDRVREQAAARVRRVVRVIEGLEWKAPSRAKVSFVANPWLRVAGIDGVFNPFPHEPIISKSLLDVEKPFIIAHELAHVRGYPDEGDANLIAVLATLPSRDLQFQYSGWMALWLYLRTPELDRLLDDGPRDDLRLIFNRARSEQIRWISSMQSAVLDLFLKANSVGEGVRSYSRVVVLAAGTEPYWRNFED